MTPPLIVVAQPGPNGHIAMANLGLVRNLSRMVLDYAIMRGIQQTVLEVFPTAEEVLFETSDEDDTEIAFTKVLDRHGNQLSHVHADDFWNGNVGEAGKIFEVVTDNRHTLYATFGSPGVIPLKPVRPKNPLHLTEAMAAQLLGQLAAAPICEQE